MSDRIGPATMARLLMETRRAGRTGLDVHDIQACVALDANRGRVGKDKARQAAKALVHVGLVAHRFERYVALAPRPDEDALMEQAFAYYTKARVRQNRRKAEKAAGLKYGALLDAE